MIHENKYQHNKARFRVIAFNVTFNNIKGEVEGKCIFTHGWRSCNYKENYTNIIKNTSKTYQMMFMSFNSNTTGVSCRAGTTDPSGAPEFLSDLYWLRVVRSLAFCVMFCSLWVFGFFLLLLLSFFFWSLYSLSLFNLRFLITSKFGIFKHFLSHLPCFGNPLYVFLFLLLYGNMTRR